MTDRWGRFTARGGERIEARLRSMLGEIRDALASALRGGEYRAVVLIGGYGRGEGGVVVEGGEERPHNNFDFLIIAHRGVDLIAMKQRADDALAPLAERFGIGMDVGTVSDSGLRGAPCLVMWYDMRLGHKTILGDATFVPALDQFRIDRIVPWDVRNLLVNRGTLLVINAVLLERPTLDDVERRTVIKHAVKAIIGYGDALLFSLGDYHWSYLEKQRRMRRHSGVPGSFRTLYDEAMDWRFVPDYDQYEGRDLVAHNDALLTALAPIHLRCEASRLSHPGLCWDDYAEIAFRHGLSDGLGTPRGLARRALGLARSRSSDGALRGARARLGFRTSRMREKLPILFPPVAYGPDAPGLRALAESALGARSGTPEALRRAFLGAWCDHGDVNFPALLHKLSIDLDTEPSR